MHLKRPSLVEYLLLQHWLSHSELSVQNAQSDFLCWRWRLGLERDATAPSAAFAVSTPRSPGTGTRISAALALGAEAEASSMLQQGEDSFLAYVQKVLTFSAACASLMMKRTTEGSKGKGGEFCCCSGCGEVVCKRSSIGRFSFSFANFALCHHDHVLGLQPLLALAHAHGTSTARRTAVAILLVLVR